MSRENQIKEIVPKKCQSIENTWIFKNFKFIPINKEISSKTRNIIDTIKHDKNLFILLFFSIFVEI